LNPEDWETKYLTKEAHWDHGAASPGLVDFLAEHPELERGTIAVPGCGTGHDVLAWADAGFQVSGFDIAPSAVRLGRERAAAAGCAAMFYQLDFLHSPPPARYDHLFEHTLFCAIEPGERDAYVRAVTRWMRPGGMYLSVNYIVCGPEGPPWPVTVRELWDRFTPHFDLMDQWVPRSYPNRCGRELMLWWRRRID
jgi:ubiquinone/menaquinone biosynthesis C-methylase UbiE